jgi:hypothetical protein
MIFFLKTQAGWREGVDLALRPPPQEDIDLCDLTDDELNEPLEHARTLSEAKQAIIEARNGGSGVGWTVA